MIAASLDKRGLLEQTSIEIVCISHCLYLMLHQGYAAAMSNRGIHDDRGWWLLRI